MRQPAESRSDSTRRATPRTPERRPGRRLLPLVAALSLLLGACAILPPRPDAPGTSRLSPFEAFAAQLAKVFENLKAALRPQPEPFRPDQPRPVGRKVRPDTAPMLGEAVTAFERADYGAALGTVNRTLAADPESRAAIELKKAILHRLGQLQFEQERYADAYATLMELAKLAPDYEDSAGRLRTLRDRLVRTHFDAGLRLFSQERVEEAIAEWRIALKYDPEHENTRRNLEQAERILKGLDERRKQERRPPDRDDRWRVRAQPA